MPYPKDDRYVDDPRALNTAQWEEIRERGGLTIDKSDSEFKIHINQDGDGNLIAYVIRKIVAFIIWVFFGLSLLVGLGILDQLL